MTYVHTDTLRLLVKRYVPSGTSSSELCINSASESQVMGIVTVVESMGFTFQLYAGILCLHALWKTKCTSKSRSIRLLTCHMVALELTNAIGFVTALIGFMSCLGRFRHTEIDQWKFLTADDWWFVLYMVSNVAFVMSGLLTDGILIWRCRQILKATRSSRPKLLLTFPIMLFLASIALAGFSCTDMERFFSTIYFSISLVLNVFLTCIVVFRLLKCKYQTQTALGKEYGRHYSVLSIIFAESASMNILCSIVLLMSNVQVHWHLAYGYSVWDTIFQVFLAITPSIQACSNYLIIYRGTQRSYGSWTNEVSNDNIPPPLHAPPNLSHDDGSIASDNA